MKDNLFSQEVLTPFAVFYKKAGCLFYEKLKEQEGRGKKQLPKIKTDY